MRMIDANIMAEDESEAYIKAQTSEQISPITQGINSVVHRKIQQLIADTPTIAPETLPVVKELREKLARITAERDAAVEALAKAKSCEACAHAGGVSSGACETADYECAACAAVCVCKDCREGSLWKWKGAEAMKYLETLAMAFAAGIGFWSAWLILKFLVNVI